MAKRATAFELTLLPCDPRTPAYRWLYASVRTGILDGHIRPGTRLPASRDLACRYGISRGTVISAFEQLTSEGYLEGRMGSGTFVSRILPDDLFRVEHESGNRPALAGKLNRRLSFYGRRLRQFHNFQIRPTRAFRANLPALDLFPTTLWAHITARCMRHASAGLLLGCDPMGYEPLREAIAGYLNTSRGTKCTFEQIAIVSGVQEAIDLVARIFLNAGDRVCMENPGYTGAAMEFRALGATISRIGVDDAGIKVPQAKLSEARLLYVTPAHQFPTGVSMSLQRRLALLQWARKSGALIFEDDYDSEFRYSGRPIPALQGLDSNGQVLLAGSFSKVLFPSLRLGYLVLPRDLASYFAASISLTNRHAPVLEQVVLAEFMNEGHFGRHLRRMRDVYAGRLAVLLQSAQQKLAGLLDISEIEAGLQTVGWLCGTIDGESATRAAATHGIEVIPLNRYGSGRRAREGLQLGFAALDANEIRRGVQELAIALERIGRS